MSISNRIRSLPISEKSGGPRRPLPAVPSNPLPATRAAERALPRRPARFPAPSGTHVPGLQPVALSLRRRARAPRAAVHPLVGGQLVGRDAEDPSLGRMEIGTTPEGKTLPWLAPILEEKESKLQTMEYGRTWPLTLVQLLFADELFLGAHHGAGADLRHPHLPHLKRRPGTAAATGPRRPRDRRGIR